MNTYSGDYARDSKNFISIRDLPTPNKYQFFLHFEAFCSLDLFTLQAKLESWQKGF
jgi:hypothetical protein